MSLEAHLVDVLFDGMSTNSHVFSEPAGVWLDSSEGKWIIDRSKDMLVHLSKNGEAEEWNTLDDPSSVATEGNILVMASREGFGEGEIFNHSLGKPRCLLYRGYDVCMAGERAWALLVNPHKHIEEVYEVTWEKDKLLLSSDELELKGEGFTARCSGIPHFTASGQDIFLLANMARRNYADGNGGESRTVTDYRLVKLTAGEEPKFIQDFGEQGDSIKDLCANGQDLFICWDQDNDCYLTVNKIGKDSTLERITFAGEDPLKNRTTAKKDYEPPFSVNVKSYGNKTLMLLASYNHVGLYELRQKR